MNNLTTRGLVLNRTNYGEADRIITVITSDLGKINLIVKGARRSASRLAGGIELFSVSELTIIRGRSDLATLISARPKDQFAHISSDLERIELGFYLLNLINKTTEANAEADYFNLLAIALHSLNQPATAPQIVKNWFEAQLIKLSGHQPDLKSDQAGQPLKVAQSYEFNMSKMAFAADPAGRYTERHIKLIRLLFSGQNPARLSRVEAVVPLSKDIDGLLQAMISQFIRL